MFGVVFFFNFFVAVEQAEDVPTPVGLATFFAPLQSWQKNYFEKKSITCISAIVSLKLITVVSCML